LKIATIAVLDEEVNIILCNAKIIHPDQVWMIDDLENFHFSFLKDFFESFRVQVIKILHYFDSHNLLCFGMDGLINHAKLA
jgi:hypothetical protein